jgi:hypothetical protein
MRASSAAAARSTERSFDVERALDIERRAPPAHKEWKREVERSSAENRARFFEIQVEGRALLRGCWWVSEEHDHGAGRVLVDHLSHLRARTNERRGVEAPGDPPFE